MYPLYTHHLCCRTTERQSIQCHPVTTPRRSLSVESSWLLRMLVLLHNHWHHRQIKFPEGEHLRILQRRQWQPKTGCGWDKNVYISLGYTSFDCLSVYPSISSRHNDRSIDRSGHELWWLVVIEELTIYCVGVNDTNWKWRYVYPVTTG